MPSAFRVAPRCRSSATRLYHQQGPLVRPLLSNYLIYPKLFPWFFIFCALLFIFADSKRPLSISFGRVAPWWKLCAYYGRIYAFYWDFPMSPTHLPSIFFSLLVELFQHQEYLKPFIEFLVPFSSFCCPPLPSKSYFWAYLDASSFFPFGPPFP